MYVTFILRCLAVLVNMTSYQPTKPRSGNGHSSIVNRLFGSAINFLPKLAISLLGGNNAATYSGRLRYRLTKWIASKMMEWK